ncbi:MAG: SUMF1/EgtB/PvdO family nonheme iron enzyme, partial [Planctomycetota bacterium]
MAENVSDEAFARVIEQMGLASFDQLEAARTAQAESAKQGTPVSLGDVLMQRGVITLSTRQSIEKKAQAQQVGGIKQLGAYKLIKKLGEGGMGAVYLAEDVNAGRKVAVKVLPKRYSENREFLTRFRREAQATGKLNHPNIVSAYTIDEEMGVHYYAMEYCEGETLDKILKQRQFIPWDEAAGVILQVASGLQHAHEHDIVHRDIKPANIFICAPPGSAGVSPATSGAGGTPALQEGFLAKILDLGLSKSIGGTEQSFYTQTGVALGTPHYIAPEQAKGEKVIDGRADIYSLGATLYHLVTGQTPFQGTTAAIIMTKHLTEQLPNPQDVREDIPDGVALTIQRMMAKDPADRYPSCKELLADLQLIIEGKMPSSQALDTVKSSVAMARVPRASRPPLPLAHARGSEPSRDRKGAVRGARHVGRVANSPHEPGELATRPTAKYIAVGAAVLVALAVIVAWALSGQNDKPETRNPKLEGLPKNEAARTSETPKPEAKPRPPVAVAKPPEVKTTPAAQPETQNQKPESARAGPEAGWETVFDGKTTDCLEGKGYGAWQVENGALTNVPGQNNAANTMRHFGVGEVRVRFETVGGEFALFVVRDNAIEWGAQQLPRLAGKEHELLFHCVPDQVTAAFDGRAVVLRRQGASAKGPLHFNFINGRLRVLGIEYRQAPAARPETKDQPKTELEAPPQPAVTAKPETTEQKPEGDAARAAQAQQLFSAVLKESAPLLKDNKFSDALAFLDRKAKDPALADATELLKQEKADVESVVELRKAALEALRNMAGKAASLKVGGKVVTGKVKEDAQGKGVVLVSEGAEFPVSSEKLSVDDVDQYAPVGRFAESPGRVGNSPHVDLRKRGLLFLYAGDAVKAKECFTKAAAHFAKLREAGLQGGDQQFGKMLDKDLDRLTALELGETEAAALKAWEKAEQLFGAKDMQGAKAAYEAFEREHGKTQTATKNAKALEERFEAIEKALGPAPELALNLGGGVKMELVLVKAGEFMMGGTGKSGTYWQGNQGPIHKVTITKPYYVGKYPVTVAQFAAFVNATKYQTDCEKAGNKGISVINNSWGGRTGINWREPGLEQTPDHPVVLVSWNDTQAFVAWASKQSGRDVRLPSEAQWEYAARGPKSLEYPFGEKWDGLKANHCDAALKNSGWRDGGCSNDNDGYAYTSPVGKLNNPSWCGAYDMSGNVRQWVQDWEADYAGEAQVDPQGPTDGQKRVGRGGSWCDPPEVCRAAFRTRDHPDYVSTHYGFRVVVGGGSSRTKAPIQPPAPGQKTETAAQRISLFDGRGALAWTGKAGEPCPWKIADAALVATAGDIWTKQQFQDFKLHVEFWVPQYPAAVKGQERGNSGVFLQGRYEIQILDSYGLHPQNDDCGAIYGLKAPDKNACTKPETWQAYDVLFHAARFDDAGKKTQNARVTIHQNGVPIHNDVELAKSTDGMQPEAASPGPIGLQEHGGKVRFRNIWIEAQAEKSAPATAAPGAGLAKEIALDLGGGVKMELVLVPAGEFDMGANDGAMNEKPIHKVKLSQPYYIGKQHVTVAQFRAFAEAEKYRTEAEKQNKACTVKDGKWQEVPGANWRNPGFKQEENHPVVAISWNDAQEFCKWATGVAQLAKLRYAVRLPTEAEWEYAARGPQSVKYPWGDKWASSLANVADASLRRAGFDMQQGEIKEDDGYPFTSPGGAYKNASWCGALDMAGNARQWCQDCFNAKYYAESPAVDPQGPANGTERLLRGGCWVSDPSA